MQETPNSYDLEIKKFFARTQKFNRQQQQQQLQHQQQQQQQQKIKSSPSSGKPEVVKEDKEDGNQGKKTEKPATNLGEKKIDEIEELMSMPIQRKCVKTC